MGMLLEGAWTSDPDDFPRADDGRFTRGESTFRNWVTADGRPGPDGQGGFRAEPGRYHLYVSLACPWASRVLLFRRLLGLGEAVGLSVVHPLMGDDGWVFDDHPGSTPDGANGFRALHRVYAAAKPDYTGRVTVPVLWDKARRMIVSNESSEILRMLNGAFRPFAAPDAPDFYPADLREEIDAVNARVYRDVNNGVYRAGFAGSQEAYEAAYLDLFAALDWLEERLSRQRWLAGARVTEADWRLFTTLVRFDAVYVGHFKCNRNRLVDMPALWAYTRDLHQVPGAAETVNLDHIKRHYYASHRGINPTGIVPAGPEIDFSAPHGREAMG